MFFCFKKTARDRRSGSKGEALREEVLSRANKKTPVSGVFFLPWKESDSFPSGLELKCDVFLLQKNRTRPPLRKQGRSPARGGPVPGKQKDSRLGGLFFALEGKRQLSVRTRVEVRCFFASKKPHETAAPEARAKPCARRSCPGQTKRLPSRGSFFCPGRKATAFRQDSS